MSVRKEDSALGVARARFVDGLPKKGGELKGALALLAATPDSERSREEMRRRMHALYASAQVFRIDALAEALKECIDLLDAARDQKRALVQDEIDRIAHVAATLPAMASASADRASEAPSPMTMAARPTRKPAATLQGLGLPRPMPSDLPPSSVAPAAMGSGVDAPTSPGGVPATTPGGVASPSTAPQANALAAAVAQNQSKSVPATSPKTASTLPMPKPRAPIAMRSEGAPATGVPPRANPAPEKPGTATGTEKATAVGHRTPSASSVPAAMWSKPPTARPPAGRESLPGLDTVVSVLLVGDAAKRIADKLPKERFEVVLADEADAVDKARISAPDVVVVGEDLLTRTGSTLVASLRADPATDLVPLIAVSMRYGTDAQKARTFGADDVFSQVADARTIVQTIARASGLLADSRSTRVGTTTVKDLVDRLTDEVRRGLLDSVERGAEENVQLDDGSEVLAAIWAAIARVRTEVGAKSEGRVRFRESARRGGPSLLGFGAPVGEGAADPTLEGRRVIVADDDPAVVWFFAGLLREAGAIVEEVLDGEAALMAARRQRPDVILSDILMPRLDGLALCRELQRDPSLAEVPVILLSWKEDFLQRMRELRSGASAYLRKEEGAPEILARVSAVLAPRARFEARLRQAGELRGRVEGLGVLGVLRAVGVERRNASVAVRDAHNLFEIEIRDGDVVHITRTASDGSFARGPRALPQLLGVTAGRFTVTDGTAQVRATIKGASGKALFEAAERLGAQIDAVGGGAIAAVETIRFDEDVLASVVAVSTPDVVSVAKKLEQGTSPRALLTSGDCAPSLLESVLADLARRGAISAVLGPKGEDRVEEALARRRGEVLKEKPKTEPPPAARSSLFDPTSWMKELKDFELPPTSAKAPTSTPTPDNTATEDDVFDDVELLPLSTPPPARETQPLDAADFVEDDVEAEDLHGHSSPHEEPTKRIDMVAALREAGLSLPPVLGSTTSSEDGRERADQTPIHGMQTGRPLADLGASGRDSDDVVVGVPSLEPESPEIRLAAKPTAVPTKPAPPQPSGNEAKKGVPLFIWGLLLVALAGLGFGATLIYRHLTQPARETERPVADVTPPTTDPAPDTDTPPADDPVVAQPDVPRPGLLLYGSDEPTLRDGVEVPPGQGLLVVEASPTPTDVGVDGRPHGRAPTSLALPPGRHEVVLTSADETRVRFVFVEAGHSRVLPTN